jgi:hypothetical protein
MGQAETSTGVSAVLAPGVSPAELDTLGNAAGLPRELTTRAGDILLISKYAPHLVSTPADPGHSVHLAFAVNRDVPGDLPRRREGTP